jgi:hypothetical protein
MARKASSKTDPSTSTAAIGVESGFRVVGIRVVQPEHTQRDREKNKYTGKCSNVSELALAA